MRESAMRWNQQELIAELAPLRRDLISDGYDEALARLARRFPLKLHEYATGTECWTWRVPSKWTCDEAFVETLDGKRVIDQRAHPLHVASYSQSIDGIVTREELLAHLHVHPLVEAPPFIFHYYEPKWGFCCGPQTREALTEPQYRVVIQSRFEPGKLKVGEWVLRGETDEWFVLCGHLCHPAQANDGLSGVVTALAAMEKLASRPKRRFGYRLLILPETIGSISWLSHHEELIPRLQGGLFLDMTGLDQPPALQLSYFGDTELDKCFGGIHLAGEPCAWCAPYRGVVGNDERQFNAPGVRVPMLSYSRALPWGHPHRPYAEYHSAADNVSLVSADALEKSKATVLAMIEAWETRWFHKRGRPVGTNASSYFNARTSRPCSSPEANVWPLNRFKGEVFLSGFNLAVDRHQHLNLHRNRLKIMDCIDGTNSVHEIAERVGVPFAEVRGFIDQLEQAGLVDLLPCPVDPVPELLSHCHAA